MLGLGRIAATADDDPPAADGGHGGRRRLVRGADHDVSIVGGRVVDPVGDGPADRPTGEVVVQHVPGLAPLSPAAVLEVAGPLLLLGINADDRPSAGRVQLAHPGQVAELAIPPGVVHPRRALAVGPRGEAPLPQQPGDGSSMAWSGSDPADRLGHAVATRYTAPYSMMSN